MATPAQHEREKQRFGEALGDFSLAGINAGASSLSQRLEGKKAGVVLFWSGVCSHCERYDQYLNEFEQRHPDVAFTAVASRHGETVEMIRKTMADRRLTFPIYFDAGSVVAKEWFTQQTPRVFLMDPQRTLIYRGAIDNFKYAGDPEYVAYLEPAIEAFLKGEPVTKQETASYGCAIFSVYYILPKAL